MTDCPVCGDDVQSITMMNPVEDGWHPDGKTFEGRVCVHVNPAEPDHQTHRETHVYEHGGE
jgi:hypothetical protein